MRISADFLAQGPNAAREEAATVALIRIVVGNRCATDMRVSGEAHIVDHIVAPAYPLAEALAYRWWALSYGRGHTYRLRSMRAGFALPDVSIIGLGNDFIDVRCEPFVYENPDVQFVTRAVETISIDTFQDHLNPFIEAVVQRLRDVVITDTPLLDRWSRIKETMADPDEMDFCKAAGAFGVDPYTCGDNVATLIENASRMFEGDELQEFLAGVDPERASAALEWLRRAERQADDWSVLPAVEQCRTTIAFQRGAAEPYTVGYASARKVRRSLGLDETEPVGDVRALASRLGNRSFRATEQSNTGLRGVSRLDPGKPRAIVSGSRHPATLMFAVARTFGDAIHFGGPHWSPVTDQLGTYRQQLSRAFAAEFLAPGQAVIEMDKRGDPIDDIAANFGVSEIVIQRQIENAQNVLPA